MQSCYSTVKSNKPHIKPNQTHYTYLSRKNQSKNPHKDNHKTTNPQIIPTYLANSKTITSIPSSPLQNPIFESSFPHPAQKPTLFV